MGDNLKGDLAILISIHSPHTRGDDADGGERHNHHGFQSTPLTRGETRRDGSDERQRGISIHSPHTRGDAWNTFIESLSTKFQSTPLTRGETRPD